VAATDSETQAVKVLPVFKFFGSSSESWWPLSSCTITGMPVTGTVTPACATVTVAVTVTSARRARTPGRRRRPAGVTSVQWALPLRSLYRCSDQKHWQHVGVHIRVCQSEPIWKVASWYIPLLDGIYHDNWYIPCGIYHMIYTMIYTVTMVYIIQK
jgi:hypothetical protein